MPCYHPLVIKQVGVDSVTGKAKTVMVQLKKGMDTTGCAVVPCGQCIGCRIDYARKWADRCMLEAMDHESNYFLTLTYDDDHLETVRRKYIDNDGKEQEILSLNKRDLQLFHKSLRKALDQAGRPKIRFFACGEYGEKNYRCHMHEICFGLVLDDLKFYKYNSLKQPLYTSEFLNKIWKKGYVIVGNVTWESCAYVSRYVTKKLKGHDSALYAVFNIEPPFVVMSRKPGIGASYYEKHPEMFDYTCFSLPTEDGSRKIYPSRFFKTMLERDNKDKFEEVRRRSQDASEIKFNSKKLVSDLDMVDQLKVEEETFKNRVKILQRKEI